MLETRDLGFVGDGGQFDELRVSKFGVQQIMLRFLMPVLQELVLVLRSCMS